MSDASDRPLVRSAIAFLEHARDAWDVQYLRVPRVKSVATPAERVTDPQVRAEAPATATPASINIHATAATREAARTWSPHTKLEYLRSKNVGDCKRCPLHRTRTNIVFGAGDPEAKIMFVGEAPGAAEDRKGVPFVGRAGQRLEAWLSDFGLARDDVYIANVLKCRPPGNRDPEPAEVDRCSPFLKAQIRAIRPRVIVALGRHAGMLLARRDDLSLRAMRGANLHYDAGTERGETEQVPLVVTYHPAYVLRQESAGEAAPATAAVKQDLRRALDIVKAST